MKCTAHRKNGDQCKAWAIQGGSVCRVHGGMAPQVQAAAARRIAEARDLTIDLYILQLKQQGVDPAVCVRAIKDFSEIVETLEGRIARREEVVTVDQVDREIAKLTEELTYRLALDSGTHPDPG